MAAMRGEMKLGLAAGDAGEDVSAYVKGSRISAGLSGTPWDSNVFT